MNSSYDIFLEYLLKLTFYVKDSNNMIRNEISWWMKDVWYSSDKTLSGARRHNPNTLKAYILHWTNCNFMQGNLCRKRGYLTLNCWVNVWVPRGIFSNNLFMFAETFTIEIGIFRLILLLLARTNTLYSISNQGTCLYELFAYYYNFS